MGEIISGRVKIRDGLFEIVSAPEMTEEVLRRLGLLLLEAVKAGEGPEEAARRVEDESPALANWIRETFQGWKKPLFNLLLGAIVSTIVDQGVTALLHHPEVVYNITVQQSELSPQERQEIVQDIMRRLEDAQRSDAAHKPHEHNDHHSR